MIRLMVRSHLNVYYVFYRKKIGGISIVVSISVFQTDVTGSCPVFRTFNSINDQVLSTDDLAKYDLRTHIMRYYKRRNFNSYISYGEIQILNKLWELKHLITTRKRNQSRGR